jgi:hypothetical protein
MHGRGVLVRPSRTKKPPSPAGLEIWTKEQRDPDDAGAFHHRPVEQRGPFRRCVTPPCARPVATDLAIRSDYLPRKGLGRLRAARRLHAVWRPLPYSPAARRPEAASSCLTKFTRRRRRNWSRSGPLPKRERQRRKSYEPLFPLLDLKNFPPPFPKTRQPRGPRAINAMSLMRRRGTANRPHSHRSKRSLSPATTHQGCRTARPRHLSTICAGQPRHGAARAARLIDSRSRRPT